MKNNQLGKILGIKEHLLLGKPITAVEALLFFGVPSLTGPIYAIRQEGWIIKKQRVPFLRVMKRINEYAILKPPKNLPIREIQLTEYWLSK